MNSVLADKENVLAAITQSQIRKGAGPLVENSQLPYPLIITFNLETEESFKIVIDVI